VDVVKSGRGGRNATLIDYLSQAAVTVDYDLPNE
jgi:hypothetical protein